MLAIFREHEGFWDKERKKSLLQGILFLAAALVVQFFAGGYWAKSLTNFAGDLFLDNLPTVNLNHLIVEGAFLVLLLSVIIMTLKPRYLLFSLKIVSLFIITRSFFVTLTHIGIYPNAITLGDGAVDRFYALLNLQDGFFFSGHTGMPYLGALIFWREKFWRYFFLAVSVLFGMSVLLAHVHYSIDVFAAPFITYALFKLGELELFRRDYAVLIGENPTASMENPNRR